uniref:hepatic sodium/bile acid cotransporter n=1 Tax=Lonchura striata TaxID=40157 RepID=UPI000B4C9807|nr:sodium/bile acid cotransporter [Lonchura striata domestica]XP_021396433.1 sodium/bile acid cotransporter [Lonchura striata domestica]XP_031360866.1 sodium/bile acid cotransporter [Lonchura striata domestica]
MNKTKGAFDSPELWSPGCRQSSTSLTSLAPPFASGQQAIDTALNIILIVVLLVIMVSLGCTIEIAKITTHLRRPKGVAIAVLVQYSIMPLTAFILGKLFQLGTSESLAILICGCCPGGNLSNIFSLALRGDGNLSVVMTACSMVLAIGLMPLLLYLYSGGLYEDDLQGKVPYKGIITSLVLMLIPCAIGIILNEKKPQYTGLITKAGMVMLLLSSAAIIVLSVANMGSCIMVVFSPSLLGTSALMPLTGFLLGYAVSAAFKLDDRCRRTVCMETGCQNVQLCSAILKVTFTPEIIGPLYFFPLLYLLFQLGEAFLIILVFRIHDRKMKANDAAKIISASVDTFSAEEIKSVSRHCRNSGKPEKQYTDSEAVALTTLQALPSAASS